MRNQVFISYRQESGEHSAAVRKLGTALRDANLPVVLDQFYLDEHPGGPDVGWAKWCDDCAVDSTCVLIIASDGWFAAFEQIEGGSGKGARFEADLIRQALYDDAPNGRIRLVFLHNVPAERIPRRLRSWQYFRPFDGNEELHRLVRWVSERLQIPTVVAGSIRWPAPVPFEPDLANRDKKEWPAILSLLSCDIRERILLIQGGSGLGKSELIRQAKCYVQKLGIPAVHVDFKGARLTPEEVLEIFDLDLGGRLPTFSRERPLRSHLLRKDLRALQHPVLLIFDSYEGAANNHPINELLLHKLLPEVERSSSLAVIIAGQQVPDPATGSWRDLARLLELEPIRDHGAWHDWLSRRYSSFEGDLPTLVKASNGSPALMATICANVAKA